MKYVFVLFPYDPKNIIYKITFFLVIISGYLNKNKIIIDCWLITNCKKQDEKISKLSLISNQKQIDKNLKNVLFNLALKKI